LLSFATPLLIMTINLLGGVVQMCPKIVGDTNVTVVADVTVGCYRLYLYSTIDENVDNYFLLTLAAIDFLLIARLLLDNNPAFLCNWVLMILILLLIFFFFLSLIRL
jgi:hypothetical protein